MAVLQNGVEHRERFAPYVPLESILPVIVDCPAERKSPERIVQRGANEPEGADWRLLGGTLRRAVCGYRPRMLAFLRLTLRSVAWRKLCPRALRVCCRRCCCDRARRDAR